MVWYSHLFQNFPQLSRLVHPKGDQSWVFIGRTDAKAETPILWPPHAKSWLIEKDSDARRDWGQEEKGMPEDEMAGWYHRLNAYEFGWTPGVGDGQGGLACYDSWGCKESDKTEWLNWTEVNWLCIMSIPISQFTAPLSPLVTPSWLPQVLHLWLYFCFVNKFICTIFLDSTYKWQYFFPSPW